MLDGEADRREPCSLLELSKPNTQQLQFEQVSAITSGGPTDTKIYYQ